MPRRFNPREETEIRSRLVVAARRSFTARGVARTTIEELARAAGIAKGSFYRFFASKELLFFELLEASQNRLREPLLVDVPDGAAARKTALRSRLHRLVADFAADPILAQAAQQDALSALRLRVPQDVLERHRKKDRRFLRRLISRWRVQGASPLPVDRLAALVTLLVLTTLQRDFLGERLFPIARDDVVDLLCDTLVG